jgi:hypothetical protein
MKESRTGILGGTKACLCKDDTYSVDCCNGTLTAQGFGTFSKQPLPENTNPYRIQHCDTGSFHNAHIHDDVTLNVGSVHYLTFSQSHHDGCYTITEINTSNGLEILTAGLYRDCAACGVAHP